MIENWTEKQIEQFLKDYQTAGSQLALVKQLGGDWTRDKVQKVFREFREKGIEIPDPKLNSDLEDQVLNSFKQNFNSTQVAKELKLPRTTVRHIIERAEREGKFDVNAQKDARIERLEKINKELQAQLKGIHKDNLSEEEIRSTIFKLRSEPARPPSWISKPRGASSFSGCPQLLISDVHAGETVDATQILGVNEYNLSVMRNSFKLLVRNTVDYLKSHIAKPNYPGIVIPVAGDIFAGDIHEDLLATNEKDIMDTFRETYNIMIWVLENFADEFGKVFVPWVSGNHGRTTKKPRTKNRNFSNFDWLLGTMLESHFQKDPRVQFHIPNGSDAVYDVFGRTYLLTHGDQFKGGDGIIGFIGPVTRGDVRKRTKHMQINVDYDTLVMGHFHYCWISDDIIVNGSMVGYNEYADSKNMKVQDPQQALWITDPFRGLTTRTGIFVREKTEKTLPEWVTWLK